MPGSHEIQQDSNLKTYSSDSILSHYEGERELFGAEASILNRIRPVCSGQPIMDIGVGAGRTTPHLLSISNDYIGIDYVAGMIDLCKKQYSGLRFEQADARDLSKYPSDHFGLVFFSLNGVDYVPHQDREKVFHEIYRLLKKGGVFVFSTHNKLYKVTSPFHPRRIFSVNPLRFIWRLWLYFVGIFRYLKMRKSTFERDGYAMRVDGAFNYSLLTHFIEPNAQKKVLNEEGFELVALYDKEGNEISIDSTSECPWIYYLAKKV